MCTCYKHSHQFIQIYGALQNVLLLNVVIIIVALLCLAYCLERDRRPTTQPKDNDFYGVSDVSRIQTVTVLYFQLH